MLNRIRVWSGRGVAALGLLLLINAVVYATPSVTGVPGAGERLQDDIEFGDEGSDEVDLTGENAGGIFELDETDSDDSAVPVVTPAVPVEAVPAPVESTPEPGGLFGDAPADTEAPVPAPAEVETAPIATEVTTAPLEPIFFTVSAAGDVLQLRLVGDGSLVYFDLEGTPNTFTPGETTRVYYIDPVGDVRDVLFDDFNAPYIVNAEGVAVYFEPGFVSNRPTAAPEEAAAPVEVPAPVESTVEAAVPVTSGASPFTFADPDGSGIEFGDDTTADDTDDTAETEADILSEDDEMDTTEAEILE